MSEPVLELKAEPPTPAPIAPAPPRAEVPAKRAWPAWIARSGGSSGLVRIALAVVAAGAAIWQILLFVRIFASRVTFPFDLEWLEGSAIYQAYRTLQGQSTYAPPDRGYLPLAHPPGYPIFLAGLGRVFHLGFVLGRSVSFACIVLAAVVAVIELMRENQSRRRDGLVLGLMAAATAAAAVPLVQGFYDIVREDTMALLICVVAAVLSLPRKMSPRRIALVAFLLTTSLYTRLVTVFLIAWIVTFVFARHRRTGVLLALTTAAMCGIELVLLQYGSKGWFWMYVISLPASQAVERARFMIGLGAFFQYAPFLPALPVVLIALALTKRLSTRSILWSGLLVASLPASLLPYAKVGGYVNDFIPVAFFTGPVAFFLASDVIRAFAKRPRLDLAARCFVFGGGALYLYFAKYDVSPYIPTADNWQRAAAFNKRMSALEGGLIVPRQPWIPLHNGEKTQQVSDMPYLDAAWSNFTNLNLGGYLDKVHAKWALVSGTEVAYIAGRLAERYQYDSIVPAPPNVVVGEMSSLRYLLRWQDDEKGAEVLFDFEDPAMRGWTVTGEAFNPKTSRIRNGTVNAGGRSLADSFHAPLYDKASGTMTSPPFIIDRAHIGLRVGGGIKWQTRVELRVNGHTERTARAIFESETLLKTSWDVSDLQGKEATLVIIDQDTSPWGHIMCDHVIKY